MTSKSWCICAACIFAAVMAIIAAFNYVCDPFGVFGDRFFDWYSYDMTNNPRTAKVAYLEKSLKSNEEKYDSYILGCSSTSSFPTVTLSEKLGCRFYNMIMYGADMADVEETAEYLINNHTVKNIVLNVYLGNAVNYDECPDELTYGMHTKAGGKTAIEFYTRHLFANPSYSAAKIRSRFLSDEYLSLPFDVFDPESGEYDKRKRDAESVSDIESYLEEYPIFANYPKRSYTMPYIRENAESVRRIRELCENAGVNLITVACPVYSGYFEYFNREDIEKFYASLAEASGGFWDFAVSSVSFEPRYFYDETHFKNDVGEMMAARIFGDEDRHYCPDDFGEYVTEESALSRVDRIYEIKAAGTSSYTKRVPILLYHHISDNLTSSSVITPKTFERQMKLLSERGYTALATSDIIAYIEEGKELPEKCVLITFDDGYTSNLEIAAPIMRKYGMRGTVFAIGVLFGENKYKDTEYSCVPHFSPEQAKEYSDVIEVQSHSFDLHQEPLFEGKGYAFPDMLKLADEDDESYIKRINDDCERMNEALGYTPAAVSFPHGASDILLRAILNENGVRLTFTTEYVTPTLIKGLSQSGYMLGRYTMYDNTPDETLIYFLEK